MKKAEDTLIRANGRLLPGNKSTQQITERSVTQGRAETALTIAELERDGVPTTPPKTRGECPTYRPCPFVSCRYHLAFDITPAGSIKANWGAMQPWDVPTSCALDLTDQHPEGLTLDEIGGHLNLTRERVRQIEQSALNRLMEYMEVEDEDIIINAIKAMKKVSK